MIAESAIFEVTSRQKQIPQSRQKYFQRQNPQSIDLFASWDERNKKDVLAFVFICDKKDASAINYGLQDTLLLILFFLAFSLKNVKVK